MTGAEIFDGLADVFEAGAKHLRGYVFNVVDQHAAEALEAQARKAREIAEASRGR